MATIALGTLLAVAHGSKRAADRGGRIWANMQVAAVLIRAVAANKVNTPRHTLGGKIMGKVALLTGSAFTMTHELLADGDFVDVVSEAASRTIGTDTCG